MYARVSTAQVQPGKIDAYLHMIEQLEPELKQIPGGITYYQLMSRESHKGMMVALYETEAAASAALGKVQEIVGKVLPFLVKETVVVEEYEVSTPGL